MPTALFTQTFGPNIRLISGAVNPVFPEDYVLNCDTAANAVSLELPEIPLDFWSTQYKLIVVDFGNNAAVNNIIITAPAGFTINGQASVVINSNGASFFVTVGNNTNYLGLYGGIISGGGGTGVLSVTNAQLLALVNASAIIPSQIYFVTDVSNVDFAAGEGVYVQGFRVNTQTTVTGSGYYLNADYQGVGNYTGTPIPFLNFKSIWYAGIAPLGTGIGTVCVFNNQHYITQTGTWWNGVLGSTPATDAVNWTLMPRTSSNVGYIRVIDGVKYNINSNQVVYRQDDLGNEVDLYVSGLINSLTYFQWGRSLVTGNKLRGSSYFNARNSFCTFTNNTLDDSLITDTTSSSSAGVFVGNSLSNNSLFNITTNIGVISYNKLFNGGGLVVEAMTAAPPIPTFSYNEVSNVTATLRNLNSIISNKKSGSGLSTFTGILDCSDPNVYNPVPPKTLTIDANGPYDTHIGNFLLINLADNIDLIRNLSTLFPTTFTIAPPIPRSFTITAVAAAPANSIVFSVVAPVIVTGRANGTDRITMIKSGTVNQVISTDIMA